MEIYSFVFIVEKIQVSIRVAQRTAGNYIILLQEIQKWQALQSKSQARKRHFRLDAWKSKSCVVGGQLAAFANTFVQIVDHHFRAYCDTGYMPRGSPNTRKWMDNVANACTSQRLRCVRAQVPVFYGSVHTMLDGIGITHDNKICIIELKCTTQSRANHRLTYDKTCKDLKVLHYLGKPNTERVAHQYQAGFGVLAFKNTYPEFANENIIGAVLVACEVTLIPYTPFQFVYSLYFV